MTVVAKLFSVLSFIFFLSKLLVSRLTEVVRNIRDKQQFNYSDETFVVHGVCWCIFISSGMLRPVDW